MPHKGSLGGSHRVIEGAFKQAGIISVDSIDELVASSKALAMQPRSRGQRVGRISNGAGAFVQAIDLLEAAHGLEMPPLGDAIATELKARYPSYYGVQNPIDLPGSATSEDYENGIEALREDRGVDIVLPWFVFQDSPLDEGIVEAMARLKGRQTDRLRRHRRRVHTEDVREDRGARSARLPFRRRLGVCRLRPGRKPSDQTLAATAPASARSPAAMPRRGVMMSSMRP